jgi:hypothetical protein
VKDRNEWFIWTDQRNPFHALNSSLTKYFLTPHQNNNFILISLVSLTRKITLNWDNEFKEFLEKSPVIHEEIKALNLKSFAEPFVMWIWKMFLELNDRVTPREVMTLLLETEPDRAKAFF